jgi:hypothetical protein
MKAMILTLFTVLFWSAASFAVSDVVCRGPNNLVLTFDSTEALPDGWCKTGNGVIHVNQENRTVLQANAEWDTCSKSGLQVRGKFKNGTIGYRDIENKAWITTFSGIETTFVCDPPRRL